MPSEGVKPSAANAGPVETSAAGPQAILEVHGVFPSEDAMQRAMQELQVAGFNRADLSLPSATPSVANATPAAGAEDPTADDDVRQLRTMGTSTIGATGAMIGAGLVVATGGAALIAGAAAAAVGVGAAAVTAAVHQGVDRARHEERQDAADAGRLVLSVRTPDAAAQERARTIMLSAGASHAEAVRRDHESVATLDSSAWTGA